MSYVSVKRTDDGIYQRWDHELYTAYRRQRNVVEVNPPLDHPLLNKEFLRDKDFIKITKVVKHWWAGYYYYGVFEVNNSGSHGTTVIENINSINDIIVSQALEFKEKFVEVVK